MQTAAILGPVGVMQLELPTASELLLPGVPWGRVEGFPSPSSCGRVTGERQSGTKSTNLVAKMSTRRMGYVIPPTNPAIMKIL